MITPLTDSNLSTNLEKTDSDVEEDVEEDEEENWQAAAAPEKNQEDIQSYEYCGES